MIDIFNIEFLAKYGYVGLFLSAFLAATLLPLGSEILLAALIASKYNLLLLIAVATVGNVFGSLFNYFVGIQGGEWIMRRVFRLSDSEIVIAESRFKKYGNGVLLFAWVPVIGDPLTVVAGILKTDIRLFIFFVTIGKLLRYLLVAIMIIKVRS